MKNNNIIVNFKLLECWHSLKKANVKDVTEAKYTTLQIYIDTFLSIFQNGETALHAAALFGHMKITRLLMSFNADRTIKNKVCCMNWI